MPHRNMIKIYDIHTAEIFPCHLRSKIYRDDRTSGKDGGVLLTVTNKILSDEQNSITCMRDTYVSSFYKPHEHDKHSLKELWSSPKHDLVE